MTPNHPLYRTYHSMKSRCGNPNDPNYRGYGAKGVSVCKEWLDNPDQFAADMGDRPDKHTLDRIDPYGNYTPQNCRWATAKTQSNNQRSREKGATSKFSTSIDGEYHTIPEWAEKLGVSAHRIYYYIQRGAEPREAIIAVAAHKQGRMTPYLAATKAAIASGRHGLLATPPEVVYSTNMKNVNDLHRKLCPTKSLSNFWRSIDYKAAEKAVLSLDAVPKASSVEGTQVHPLVAAAFVRWADPDKFYEKLKGLL